MLKELILKYENDFFKQKFCSEFNNLDNRIHDEFVEYGKTGMYLDKNITINFLMNLECDRNIEIKSFLLKKLSENMVMANYIALEKDELLKTARTSIWIKDGLDWKIYFHQGTIIV